MKNMHANKVGQLHGSDFISYARKAGLLILRMSGIAYKLRIGFNALIVEWFGSSLRRLILDTMRSAEFKKAQYSDGNGHF